MALQMPQMQLIISLKRQPDRHYITLHIIAKKHRGELKVMEPTKEDRWEWFDLDKLPQNLYSPSKKFIEEYLK